MAGKYDQVARELANQAFSRLNQEVHPDDMAALVNDFVTILRRNGRKVGAANRRRAAGII